MFEQMRDYFKMFNYNDGVNIPNNNLLALKSEQYPHKMVSLLMWLIYVKTGIFKSNVFISY